jgi:hypothetical protein
MGQPPHWADVLTLRQEVTDASGQVANLQMSLYSVVSKTADVPYRNVGYYGDITMPTSGLVGFMAQVAQRLGSAGATRALFHLDQGMGGGKSHALVGLYHLANDPAGFLACELGRLVLAEAEQRANGPVDVTETRVVVLPADHMTPGVASAQFGPATTLHERFIWSLFPGDFDRYRRLVALGQDKAALRTALEEADRPVLILLDELMDYAQLLSDRAHRDSMPSEQGFLNSLMDAVDDVPQVAFVVVMIKSELDDRATSPRRRNSATTWPDAWSATAPPLRSPARRISPRSSADGSSSNRPRPCRWPRWRWPGPQRPTRRGRPTCSTGCPRPEDCWVWSSGWMPPIRSTRT